MTAYDPVAESEIRRELSPQERLTWIARPRQGIRFRSSDLYLVPFSLLWAGFAVFWEATAILSGAPIFFWLWGIPFVVMGLYITVGRFFVDALMRRTTAYGLTDQRVIQVSGLRTRRVRSLDLVALADLSLTERADRSGTISFGGAGRLGRQTFAGMPWPGSELPFAFAMIDDARAVYDQIRAAQHAARGAPGAWSKTP